MDERGALKVVRVVESLKYSVAQTLAADEDNATM